MSAFDLKQAFTAHMRLTLATVSAEQAKHMHPLLHHVRTSFASGSVGAHCEGSTDV
jgi:hypothetical protein